MVHGWLRFRLPSHVRHVQPSSSLLAFVLASATFQGCSNNTFGMGQGTSNCRPGSLGCVCAADGSCDAPHLCQEDRCVDSPDAKDPTVKENWPSNKPSTQPKPDNTEDPSQTSQESQVDTTSSNSSGGGGCKKNEECADFNGPCTRGECKEQLCVAIPLPDQSPCADTAACIPSGQCQSGACKGSSSRLLAESFDATTNQWRTETRDGAPSSWEIAPAMASRCDRSQRGEDPGQDHSSGDGNRVAGTKVGGCLPGGIARDWDCILSPKIDISQIKGELEFSYWRHLHSPPYSIKSRRGAQHKVYAIIDGTTPITLKEGYSDGINDTTWTRQSHVFSASGRSLEVSICMRTGLSVESFAGWNVDDVRVRGVGCDPGI